MAQPITPQQGQQLLSQMGNVGSPIPSRLRAGNIASAWSFMKNNLGQFTTRQNALVAGARSVGRGQAPGNSQNLVNTSAYRLGQQIASSGGQPSTPTPPEQTPPVQTQPPTQQPGQPPAQTQPGTPTTSPVPQGFFGDIIDRIGDFFNPSPGPGLPGPGQPTPGFPGDPGGPGGGDDPTDLLPPGFKNILESIGDVAELIRNPSLLNFLKALDVTTANQILQAFGIEGNIQDVQDDQPSPSPSPSPDPGPGGGGMMPGGGGGFQGALMMELLQDSVSGKNASDVLEAVVSGSLNGGVIQQPERVQYGSRGEVHHVSPPGFRTVEVSGEKFSLFKPLARALGKMPSDGRTELQKMDDLARKFNAARSDLKKLAPKVGLKTSNRKSGPTR